MFEGIVCKKGGGSLYDLLVPLGIDDINQISTMYPKAPRDYLCFLREVGFGEFGNAAFMLYSSPVESSELTGLDPAEGDEIFVIGDDFSGYAVGFDAKSGVLVEIDTRTGKKVDRFDNFGAVLARKFEG